MHNPTNPDAHALAVAMSMPGIEAVRASRARARHILETEECHTCHDTGIVLQADEIYECPMCGLMTPRFE